MKNRMATWAAAGFVAAAVAIAGQPARLSTRAI